MTTNKVGKDIEGIMALFDETFDNYHYEENGDNCASYDTKNYKDCDCDVSKFKSFLRSALSNYGQSLLRSVKEKMPKKMTIEEAKTEWNCSDEENPFKEMAGFYNMALNKMLKVLADLSAE